MHTFAVPTKHSLNHTLFIVVAIAITCASPWVPSAIADSETDSYQTLIRPYLTKYCFLDLCPLIRMKDLNIFDRKTGFYVTNYT